MLYLVEQPPHCDLLRLSLSTGDLSALDGLFPSGFFNLFFYFIFLSSFLNFFLSSQFFFSKFFLRDTPLRTQVLCVKKTLTKFFHFFLYFLFRLAIFFRKMKGSFFLNFIFIFCFLLDLVHMNFRKWNLDLDLLLLYDFLLNKLL